jgi:hypothetical protein
MPVRLSRWTPAQPSRTSDRSAPSSRSSIPWLPSERGTCFPTPRTALRRERRRRSRGLLSFPHRCGRRRRLRRCRAVGVAGHGRSCWRRSSSRRGRHRGASSEIGTRRRPASCSRSNLQDRQGPKERRVARRSDPPQQSARHGDPLRQSARHGDPPRQSARRTGPPGHDRRIEHGPRTCWESRRSSAVPG